ncbi:phage tail sheath C-terminal domain-containing protein [Sphingomonas quercus]|uniref:Phage tail sheath subtilisin-like domain-containing protein n=1 Tax=Sphingomonas quercus TaxID=2842451 RepID=A0ABS6BL19_9SPHN|nr:phage tail sheath C-terminal domain-containing protein [Sphingomonas quercus]MBU3079005.1 phage tail sheath subtilisin-like domain-containing protein [Sphingomonas quercus]
MPVQPTYPGVYIEEISSGVHPITGVATSTAAFIGTFAKGLANEAVQILSQADFEREYGGLDRNSEASYAIQQFFMNGGSQAWVVRVVNDGSPAGSVAGAEANATLTVLGAATKVFNVRAGRRIRGASAINPGEWGNFVRVQVDHNGTAAGATFNLTISQVRVDGNRTTVVATETFNNLTMEPNTPNNAIEVVNQGSRLVQLDRVGLAALGTPAPRPAPSGTISNASLAAAIPAAISALKVAITLASGSSAAIALDYPGSPLLTAPASFAGWAQALQTALRQAGADPTLPPAMRPYLTGATVQALNDGAGANWRFAVLPGAGAQPYDSTAKLVFSGADLGAYKFNAASTGVAQYELAGGADGTVVDATGAWAMPVSVFRGSAAGATGLYALEDVDLFNVLCIPDAPKFAANDMQSLYQEAEIYVEGRRAMIIVDIPEDVVQIDQMQAWMTANDSLRHPNAAVYYPRTFTPDPLNQGRLRSLAPSGTMAGLWARTDTARGVWKAPAGTETQLRNVASLARTMTDQENGLLNPLGINCLRTFPIYSNICWGARTLEGADILASDWKYVPVRRTTLFIEESLFRGTKWVVFEPNDEPLWAQIRLNVGAFMQDLFRKGAFQGTTAKDAFFVKCDGETTTQTDIDLGIVNVEVGFAPLKPAEFVILKISQIARSSSTDA